MPGAEGAEKVSRQELPQTRSPSGGLRGGLDFVAFRCGRRWFGVLLVGFNPLQKVGQFFFRNMRRGLFCIIVNWKPRGSFPLIINHLVSVKENVSVTYQVRKCISVELAAMV